MTAEHFLIGYIQDAKEHIEAAIENLGKFMVQADPQSEDAEINLIGIGNIKDELKDFWEEHEGIFHEIIGG